MTVAILIAPAAIGCHDTVDPDPLPDVTTGCSGVHGPTLHGTGAGDLLITHDSVWTRCASPHVVLGVVSVQGPGAPTLTIEAGAEVRFARTPFRNAALRIGYADRGNLVIAGTAERPVTLVADHAEPTAGEWAGVLLMEHAGPSRLSYVTMRHCGTTASVAPGFEACLVAKGNAPSGRGIIVELRHVTVEGSASQGVVFGDSAAFAISSTALVVRNSASYPVAVDAEQAGSLPDGVYTGNHPDAIRVGYASTVTHSQTWRDPGVPYVAEWGIDVRGPASPMLTIAPGTTVRMGAGQTVRVGYADEGGLVAAGTVLRPVRFTSDALVPGPATWRTIEFAEHALPGSRFDYVTVEGAGGWNGYVPADSADLLIRPATLGAFITNSTIRASGGCGITVARYALELPSFDTDFTADTLRNHFTSNAMDPQCGPY